MPERIAIAPTLEQVPAESEDKSQRYDEELAKHARRELIKWRDQHRWNDSDAAKELGVAQSTFHRAVKPNAPAQPGLKLLVAFARKTGRTIDSILGLEFEQPEARADEDERIKQAVRAVLDERAAEEAPDVTRTVRKEERRKAK